MKKLQLLFPISIIALALAACSPAPTETSSAKQEPSESIKEHSNESETLAQFFAESFEEDLKRSPMTQGYLGYKWDYDKWDDISEQKANEDQAIRESRQKALDAFDLTKLTEQQQLSHRIMKTALQREEANDAFRHHRYVMHQFSGWHTQVPSFLINIHRVQNIDDAKAYVARLAGVQALFEQVKERLDIAQELGAMPPRWVYDQMIQGATNVITGNPFEESAEDSTIWTDFQAKITQLGLSDSQSVALLSEASETLQTSVMPAYNGLIEKLKLQREVTPQGDGVWRLPDGDKWYQNRLNWFTTTELTAQEIHQIGLDNVARIHEEMREIMTKVGFEGDLQAFFEYMRNDEQFYFSTTEEGRQQYMAEAKAMVDEMEAKLPEYFGLKPKARMVVKRVEAFRERSAGKAFYQSPSRDGSRPGTYYANLYNMADMPKYQMEALAYHEGIPGHHMQRAIAQELEGIPDFQKYVSFTAYTEGWGLYTEELAKDMGFYQDPYSDFGRLAMELWRACRLVVDTGIHNQKWSRGEAIEYLNKNTPNPPNDVVKAIERYIVMPGQATAYMIGKLKIMELREWSKNTLGDKFDIKGFHDEVLKDGPVPLNILENKIKTWAEKRKKT